MIPSIDSSPESPNFSTPKYPYRPSKRLGQNFLKDHNVARRIVAAGELSREDIVLEPGPGYGTLTRLIVETGARVLAVEKDHRLAHGLRESFLDEPRVSVLEGDVLRMHIPEFNKIVGTPPYNISSKLILLMLKQRFDLGSIVLQKEFGQRLLAEPGSADYGRLSVMSQKGLDIEKIGEIPRTVFQPRPKVDSVLLRLRRKTIADKVDPKLFEWLVRELFTQRRRLVRGAIRHALRKSRPGAVDEIVQRMVISESRVFQLSPGEFELLAKQLEEALIYNGINSAEIIQESPRRDETRTTIKA